jgi:hypothetical protein
MPGFLFGVFFGWAVRLSGQLASMTWVAAEADLK